MEFVDRVISLIEQGNISKNKLLTDLGLSKNSFVDWKKRGNIPSGETLRKIADYFEVSVDYLLTGTDNNSAPAPMEAEGDDLKKVIIARSPEPLADEDAETLMKLLDSTVDSTIAAFLEARKNGRKAKRK